MPPQPTAEPPPDCPLCPRLQAYRHQNAAAQPRWFNAPVPCLGATSARLLIVGLAPGVTGANRTGRPFTGDHAGILLYATLIRYGLATGPYEADPNDALTLHNCRIANAVRCVPPANLPKPIEIATCNLFLAAAIAEMPNLTHILSLGTVAHDAVLRALGLRRAAFPFAHAARHALPSGLTLTDSYHVSRYNTSTRRLTTPMFESVIAAIAHDLA